MAKRKSKVKLPSPHDVPELIDEFPYNLDQVALATNRGSKATVYRLIREGIWPKPIRIGGKPAYLGKVIRSINRGDTFLAA